MIKHIIKHLQFVPVYLNDKGKQENRGIAGVHIRTSSKRIDGVYFIKENDELVYIGKGESNVKKTLYRHFQKWTDKRGYQQKEMSSHERVCYHDRLNENKYTVSIYIVGDVSTTDNLEKKLIILHNPRDNRRKYLRYVAEQKPRKRKEKIKEEILEDAPF